MKKLVAFFISIFIIFSSFIPSVYAKDKQCNENLYGDFVLAIVSPYVMQAITEYYGKPKQFDLFSAKIINIERISDNSYYFKVTVQVKTFEEDYNPPYGLETVTLTNANRCIQIIDFKHKDEVFQKSL